MALWTISGGNQATDGAIASAIPAGAQVVGFASATGDGQSDILWRDATGATSMTTLNAGTVASTASLGMRDPSYWTVAGFFDVAGSGQASIAWRGQGGETEVWGLTGNAVASKLTLPSLMATTTWRLAGFSQQTTPGVSDLLWRGNGTQTLLQTVTNGAVTQSSLLLSPTPTGWQVQGFAEDVAHPGQSEILWRNTAGDVHLSTVSNGTLTGDALLGNLDPTYWKVVRFSDTVQNGQTSIVWLGSGGEVVNWALSGTTVASKTTLPTLDATYSPTAIGGRTVVNVPPAITGTLSAQATTDITPLQPFSAVTVADATLHAATSATITLTNAQGAASDANGLLRGVGLTKTGVGTYALAAAAPGTLTATLDALVFTPTAKQVASGQTVTTGFAITATDPLGGSSASTATSVVATAASQYLLANNDVLAYHGSTGATPNRYVVGQDLSGTGTVRVGVKAGLEFAGKVGSGQTVLLEAGLNGASTVQIDNLAGFQGAVSGFSASDTLRVLSGAYDSYAYTSTGAASGILTLSQGGTAIGGIALNGTYTQASFVLASSSIGSGQVQTDIHTVSAAVDPTMADPPARFSFSDGVNGVTGVEAGTAYTGPVSYLQYQYLWPSAHGTSITAMVPNAFIVGGAGSDALTATGGSNVLDGGGGSNFLTGATGTDGGTDTFFVDGRGGVPTWSTLVNFHHGDAVTLFGFTAGVSTLPLTASDGAPGYQGVTIHSELNGAGTGVNGSITFAGVSLATEQSKFTVTTGTVGGTNYLSVAYTG